jgi:hypothetical protein
MRAGVVVMAVALACAVPVAMAEGIAGKVESSPKPLQLAGASAPAQALNEYLRLTKQGGALNEFRAVLTKDNFAMLSMGVAMDAIEKTGAPPTNKPSLSSLKVPPGADKYAAVSMVKTQAVVDRAFLVAKVTYKQAWLKEEEEGAEAGENVTAPTVMDDGEAGEGSEWPFHVKGVGYVSFLFLRQDGSWRYHKSYAARKPVDFTPLLASSKDLNNGFSMSVDMDEPEPFASLPTNAPTTALSGVLAGKPWKGVFAQPSQFRDSDATHFALNVMEREESGSFSSFQQPHLMLKLPKKEGFYPLSGTFNVTFYQPPGNNVIATEGSMKVVRKGSTYQVGLVAYANKLNNASGTFSYVVSTGGLASAGTVATKPGAAVSQPKSPAVAGDLKAPAAPRAAALSAEKELRVRAFIDGSDVLKVRRNALWFEHKDAALPGKWANNNKPTYVNQDAWMPAWEGQVSRPFEKVQPPFVPRLGRKVAIAHTYGRGKAAILEQPTAENDETLAISMDDPDGGAEWLEVVIRWTADGEVGQPAPQPKLPANEVAGRASDGTSVVSLK